MAHIYVCDLIDYFSKYTLVTFWSDDTISKRSSMSATLLSYAIMAAVLYFIVQKIYPVEYEWQRIAKISIAAVVVFVLYYFVKLDSFELLWKVGLLVLFAALMHVMKFFDPSEVSRLRGYSQKRRKKGRRIY